MASFPPATVKFTLEVPVDELTDLFAKIQACLPKGTKIISAPSVEYAFAVPEEKKKGKKKSRPVSDALDETEEVETIQPKKKIRESQEDDFESPKKSKKSKSSGDSEKKPSKSKSSQAKKSTADADTKKKTRRRSTIPEWCPYREDNMKHWKVIQELYPSTYKKLLNVRLREDINRTDGGKRLKYFDPETKKEKPRSAFGHTFYCGPKSPEDFKSLQKYLACARCEYVMKDRILDQTNGRKKNVAQKYKPCLNAPREYSGIVEEKYQESDPEEAQEPEEDVQEVEEETQEDAQEAEEEEEEEVQEEEVPLKKTSKSKTREVTVNKFLDTVSEDEGGSSDEEYDEEENTEDRAFIADSQEHGTEEPPLALHNQLLMKDLEGQESDNEGQEVGSEGESVDSFDDQSSDSSLVDDLEEEASTQVPEKKRLKKKPNAEPASPVKKKEQVVPVPKAVKEPAKDPAPKAPKEPAKALTPKAPKEPTKAPALKAPKEPAKVPNKKEPATSNDSLVQDMESVLQETLVDDSLPSIAKRAERPSMADVFNEDAHKMMDLVNKLIAEKKFSKLVCSAKGCGAPAGLHFMCDCGSYFCATHNDVIDWNEICTVCSGLAPGYAFAASNAEIDETSADPSPVYVANPDPVNPKAGYYNTWRPKVKGTKGSFSVLRRIDGKCHFELTDDKVDLLIPLKKSK